MPSTRSIEILRLRKTVRAVCQHEDVDRALAIVLRLLSEAHGWAVAEAWVMRSDGSAFEMAPVCYCRDDRYRPFVDVALGFVVDRGVGLPGAAWESGQPIVTPDVLAEPRFARAVLVGEFGLRGALTVPVPAAEPAVILSFFDTQPRELDLELVESLTEVGPDIASLVRRRHQGLDLERQFRITEQRYRSLFDRSPAGLFIADMDGTIVDGNPSLTKIMGGATRAYVVGRRFSEFLVDPGEWTRIVARLSSQPSLTDLELRLRRDDGEIRWILTNIVKVDDKPGASHVEGVLLDLTERKTKETS